MCVINLAMLTLTKLVRLTSLLIFKSDIPSTTQVVMLNTKLSVRTVKRTHAAAFVEAKSILGPHARYDGIKIFKNISVQ